MDDIPKLEKDALKMEEFEDDDDIPSADKTGRYVQIQSMHCLCQLGVVVDCRLVASRCRNAMYDPRRINGCQLSLRHPKCTATVFASGKMITLGGTSENQAITAARKFARAVQQAGFPMVRFKNFQINSVSASGHVGFPVDIKTLVDHPEHERYTEYEPERFSGAYYRFPNPHLTICMFHSGALTITGAKSEKDVYQGFEMIVTIASKFAGGPIPPGLKTKILISQSYDDRPYRARQRQPRTTEEEEIPKQQSTQQVKNEPVMQEASAAAAAQSATEPNAEVNVDEFADAVDVDWV